MANGIRMETTSQQLNKSRLIRSKSCLQSSGHCIVSENSNSNKRPQHLPKTISRTISARGQQVQSFELIDAPLPEPTLEERKKRINELLTEIKKEQPLSKCSLFKMPLTFRWFVWSPSLNSLYGFQNAALQTPLPPVQKLLQRSNSIHSLNPSESASKRKPPEPSPKTNQIARKDIVRLNMLSSARPTIKLKSQVKLNTQNEPSSQRSLKLGAVPKYLTDRKVEWARKEEERLKSLPDPDCPAGHIVMPENERHTTLSQLQKSKFSLFLEKGVSCSIPNSIS